MTDRTTKILLAAIAAGLWANAATTFFQPAVAQSYELANISSDVSSIKNGLSGITNGLCVNRKIC